MPLASVSADNGSLDIAWSFAVPLQNVWAGFTDGSLLSRWLGQPLECDVRTGGSIVVDHSGGYLSRSAITEVDEPHHLAMTWEFPEEPESRLLIRLSDADEGTLLHFGHHGLGALVDSYGPGWITHLTFLEAALADADIPPSRFWPLHATFEALYAARPAEDPVTATP